MFKKTVKRLAVTLGLYFGYCFTRGFIYGVKNGHKADETIAYKIATFRG